MDLYPIKFKPILKERVWGGERLSGFKSLKKSANKIGESWEISSVRGNLSVAANGFLKGNTIDELIEVYMGDLVGEKVYDKFGLEFPLLLKFIDSAEELSIQVHPDDELALKRHRAYGKTEMWYIVDADKDARIYVGFKEDVNSDKFLSAVKNNALLDLINVEHPNAGDVFFLPAGRIHAIGKNILLAEIQQTSDITYRVYDWGRENNPATAREMHVNLALDAIDYKCYPTYKTSHLGKLNKPDLLVQSPYFTVNLLEFDRTTERDYSENDSFTAYMCVEGACTICYVDGEESIAKGETVLIPATLTSIELVPNKSCKLLEVYIE